MCLAIIEIFGLIKLKIKNRVRLLVLKELNYKENFKCTKHIEYTAFLIKLTTYSEDRNEFMFWYTNKWRL